MGTDIAQCAVPIPEIKFGNSSQKARTNRYQTFLFLYSFSGFLYFVSNILFGIEAPRRCFFGYSKVDCDVTKGRFLAWNQNRHITYSIFHILAPNWSLGKPIDSHWFKMSCLTCLVFSCVYCFFLKRWNYTKMFVLHESAVLLPIFFSHWLTS